MLQICWQYDQGVLPYQVVFRAHANNMFASLIIFSIWSQICYKI